VKRENSRKKKFSLDNMPVDAASARENDMLSRLVLVLGIFAFAFTVLAVRLINLSMLGDDPSRLNVAATVNVVPPRPDIFDRNGEMMATDITVASLYADARKIIDVDEASDAIGAILSDVNAAALRKKLATKRAFVWIRREVTPKQKASIYNLGLPGLYFVDETRRVYPNGRAAAHVLGYVDIDNKGIAGIEKYIDKVRKSKPKTKKAAGVEPVYLSVDLRVQYALSDELARAKEEFSAKAIAGIVIDVQSGEVVAMASLPDFDPNNPTQTVNKETLNRNTAGVYELGSTFKTFTAAMVLDSGVADMDTRYDATRPIKVGGFKIDDFKGKRRMLSVPEVFIFSSNIGAAKMALEMGVERHQEFLRRLGLFDRLVTELPENRKPLLPRDWKPVNSMTISFGHGISIAPIQMASAAAALMNGGRLITPTFLRRSSVAAFQISKQVLKPKTSRQMRELMRLNVVRGTGKKADVPGYLVGGKTGTGEKVVNGRYKDGLLLNTFLSAFPTDAPQYVMLVMIDEPKATKETFGYATAGWNAAPTTGKIIRRIAPMLGVLPRGEQLNPFGDPVMVSY